MTARQQSRAAEPRIYELTALTDLWTGDIDGKAGRLITTGLLGSIRWWFEVLVRGLEGSACDPSAKRKACRDDKHCVVCELFGCTGWARKFRFDVLDGKDIPQRDRITKEATFKLRFTPLRPIRDEEWALLDLTLRLIANYGALGGKTVYKPTDEAHRQAEPHHQDFGLVKLIHGPDVSKSSKDELRAYVRDWLDVGGNGFAWASLEHFWCVEGMTLARQDTTSSSFNRVLGREESKSNAKRLANGNDATAQWLAGGSGSSKKLFSFRDPARTFGFVAPGTISHDDMRQRLHAVWSNWNDKEYHTGDVILNELLRTTGASS